MRQLAHSFSGNNNLVVFHCGEGTLCENVKKSTNILSKIVLNLSNKTGEDRIGH